MWTRGKMHEIPICHASFLVGLSVVPEGWRGLNYNFHKGSEIWPVKWDNLLMVCLTCELNSLQEKLYLCSISFKRHLIFLKSCWWLNLSGYGHIFTGCIHPVKKRSITFPGPQLRRLYIGLLGANQAIALLVTPAMLKQSQSWYPHWKIFANGTILVHIFPPPTKINETSKPASLSPYTASPSLSTSLCICISFPPPCLKVPLPFRAHIGNIYFFLHYV